MIDIQPVAGDPLLSNRRPPESGSVTPGGVPPRPTLFPAPFAFSLQLSLVVSLTFVFHHHIHYPLRYHFDLRTF
jgi:hypothetical protein